MRADCKKEVYMNGNAFCEHCTCDGTIVDEHISIFDGYTGWCLMCAWSEGMIST